MSDLVLRPMRADERAFVATSWVRSHSQSDVAQVVRHCGGNYRVAWHRVVNALLDCCHVRVVEKDGVLVAFICWQLQPEGVVVHYVYTRQLHRREGIAKRLLAELPGGPVSYTHAPHEHVANVPIPEGWRYSLAPLVRTLGVWRSAG